MCLKIVASLCKHACAMQDEMHKKHDGYFVLNGKIFCHLDLDVTLAYTVYKIVATYTQNHPLKISIA